jgi:hypothetical protein
LIGFGADILRAIAHTPAMAASSLSQILRIHDIGDWSADQVRTSWAPSTWSAPPEVQRAIEDLWIRATIEPNRSLFDGPMCRMESWEAFANRVDVRLSRTSYKIFWGTNMMHPELGERHGPQVMANPVGVSPALETADGFLMFGRRNAEVAYYPTRIHPFAGCLEPGDVTGRKAPDLFAAVRRELAEELRLKDQDLELIRMTGIVEDIRLRQPELVFRVKTRLSRRQIEAQLERAEHEGIVAIAAKADDVAAAMRNPAMTPVGLASLLLWGRLVFGQDWFEEAKS